MLVVFAAGDARLLWCLMLRRSPVRRERDVREVIVPLNRSAATRIRLRVRLCRDCRACRGWLQECRTSAVLYAVRLGRCGLVVVSLTTPEDLPVPS